MRHRWPNGVGVGGRVGAGWAAAGLIRRQVFKLQERGLRQPIKGPQLHDKTSTCITHTADDHRHHSHRTTPRHTTPPGQCLVAPPPPRWGWEGESDAKKNLSP